MSNSWDRTVGTVPYKDNLARIQDLAQKNGFILNPDEERIKKVVGLMTMNYDSHNDYYCPCKQSHPLDPEKDVTCPCTEWQDEIQKDGYCFCKLFYRSPEGM